MTVTIGRRELLAALGGAVPWPFAARARSKTRPTLAGYTAEHNQQVNKHAGLPLGALFAALVVSGLPGSPKPRHQMPFPATFPKSAASTLPERIAAIARRPRKLGRRRELAACVPGLAGKERLFSVPVVQQTVMEF
jgi:hypothetical protein